MKNLITLLFVLVSSTMFGQTVNGYITKGSQTLNYGVTLGNTVGFYMDFGMKDWSNGYASYDTFYSSATNGTKIISTDIEHGKFNYGGGLYFRSKDNLLFHLGVNVHNTQEVTGHWYYHDFKYISDETSYRSSVTDKTTKVALDIRISYAATTRSGFAIFPIGGYNSNQGIFIGLGIGYNSPN